MVMFLTVLSGVCWTVVYLDLIRLGLRDKTCGMPLFARGLNIASVKKSPHACSSVR